MKRGSVLKKLARHPREFVGWTLLLGYAFNAVRRGYPPPGAVNLGRQKQGQGNPPAPALQDELDMAGKSVLPIEHGLPKAWQLLNGWR